MKFKLNENFQHKLFELFLKKKRIFDDEEAPKKSVTCVKIQINFKRFECVRLRNIDNIPTKTSSRVSQIGVG